MEKSGGFMAMNHENIMGNAQFNDETTYMMVGYG